MATRLYCENVAPGRTYRSRCFVCSLSSRPSCETCGAGSVAESILGKTNAIAMQRQVIAARRAGALQRNMGLLPDVRRWRAEAPSGPFYDCEPPMRYRGFP